MKTKVENLVCKIFQKVISINPHLSNNACAHCQILSIQVGSLNKNPDFEEFIQSYSIVCIQETHLDHFDSIHIPGFTPLPFMIRDRAKYRSGGIAILVKEDVFGKINSVKNSGEIFYWFSCSKLFTFDILFCAIYIPQEGSRYSNNNIFDALDSDLLELNRK